MEKEIISDGVHPLVQDRNPETEEQEFEHNFDLILKAKEEDCLRPSPINIDLSFATRIKLPALEWQHYETIPRKLKITNSGKTVILSAKWTDDRQFLVGGPLSDEYVLSDIHFHWGKTALEGSEHLVEGGQLALEMHAIHVKRTYETNDEALKHDDGFVILVYLYEVRFHHNPIIQRVLVALEKVRQASTDFHIQPFNLAQLVRPFEIDYYSYWGCINSKEALQPVLWLINRQLNSISMPQLQLFHQLLDSNLRTISRNWRPVRSNERTLFYINPVSPHTNSTMNSMPILYQDTVQNTTAVVSEIREKAQQNNFVSDAQI